MSNTRNELLDYISDIGQRFASYSCHKEMMAWLGTAFYVFVILGTLSAFEQPSVFESIAALVFLSIF